MAEGPKTKKKAKGPTVGAGYARALLEVAVARGADRTALLERAQIRADDLIDADNRVPFANYIALMREGAKLASDPALALHFGATTNFSEFSIVGLIADASKTMAHALIQLNRYGRLAVEVDTGTQDRLKVVREGNAFWLLDTRHDPNTFPELTESTFARIASHARQFGTDDKPFVQAVHVTHGPPAYAAEYDRVFRVPVTFNAERNALLIDDDWTTRKVARTGYAFGVLSAHAQALLEKLETANTTRGRVESLLIPILHTGEPNIERIAEKMGQSRKTLYRKLKAEDTTFAKLLDELRHKMALHYLNGKKVSVNETAYLVGFSDASTFSRAFKRWTGVSPKNRTH